MSSADVNAGQVAVAWWRGLVPDDDGTKPAQGWQRATVARLRRAESPLEVMMEPHALRLIDELQKLANFQADHVAVLAGALAVVRKNTDASIVRAVGRKSLDDEESATLSERRFRRLLQIKTPTDDLLEPMRRLIRLAKGEANVRHLADSILFWGDRKKEQWILDYYAVSSTVRSQSQAAARSART